MNQMTIVQVQGMFEAASCAMTANCEYLCALDKLLGDGDLGYTLRNGFCVFVETLRRSATDNLRESIRCAAEAMMYQVPATMSVVLAHGIRAGAQGLRDATVMDGAAYALFLDGMALGIEEYGRCKAGDCTVLDALLPAADGAKAAARSGADLPAVAKAAHSGALRGLRNTAAMRSCHGKSAGFSQRSLGRPDQGAAAAEILLQAFWRYIAS